MARLERWLDSTPRLASQLFQPGEDRAGDETRETPIQKLKRRRSGELEASIEDEETDLTKELKVYQHMPEPPKNHSILKFWSDKDNLFPLLAKASRVVLGVPCSSSSIERTYRTAGLQVTSQRTKMNPELVETIVLMKSNDGRVDYGHMEEEAEEDGVEESEFSDSSEEESDIDPRDDTPDHAGR